MAVAGCICACSLAALASAMSAERLIRKHSACSSSATCSIDREDATPACKGSQHITDLLDKGGEGRGPGPWKGKGGWEHVNRRG